jgi:hypothetical protein
MNNTGLRLIKETVTEFCGVYLESINLLVLNFLWNMSPTEQHNLNSIT